MLFKVSPMALMFASLFNISLWGSFFLLASTNDNNLKYAENFGIVFYQSTG